MRELRKEERLLNSGEDRKKYEQEYDKHSEMLALGDDELLLEEQIKEYKKDILFDVLFDFFIELDVEKLRKDVKLLPSDRYAEDEQILALERIRDLKNYYKVKCDLEDIKRILELVDTISRRGKNTFGELK